MVLEFIVLSFTFEILSPAHFYSLKLELITKAAQPLEPVTPASAHTSDDQSTKILLSTHQEFPASW